MGCTCGRIAEDEGYIAAAGKLAIDEHRDAFTSSAFHSRPAASVPKRAPAVGSTTSEFLRIAQPTSSVPGRNCRNASPAATIGQRQFVRGQSIPVGTPLCRPRLIIVARRRNATRAPAAP